MNLEEKKAITAQVHEKLADARIVILTDYKGLDVVSMGELRKSLREADASYEVVKNTLLRRASEGTDAAQIREVFTGPSGVAFGTGDPAAAAKALIRFSKDHEHLKIKAGVIAGPGGEPGAGAALTPEEITALADLPPREVLLSHLMGTVGAVPTSFVRTLNAIVARLVYVLAAIRDAKDE